MTETLGTIIVANRTGGQGKTLVAQLLALGAEAAGHQPQLVAIDSDREGSVSKLGKYLPDVSELRISPDLEALRRDPRSSIAHWDRLGEILLAGDCLVDVGANVVGALFDWAILRRAGDVLRRRNAPPITLVVPMRAQAQAVEDALDLLERSQDPDGVPIAQRVLVLNEVAGSFEQYGSNNDFARLRRLKAEIGLKIIRLGLCNSELWPLTERLYLPLRDVVASTTDTLEQRFGLNPFAAAGAHADLLRWLAETLETMRGIGLVGRPVTSATA